MLIQLYFLFDLISNIIIFISLATIYITVWHKLSKYKTNFTPENIFILEKQPCGFGKHFIDSKTISIQKMLNIAILETGLYLSIKYNNLSLSSIVIPWSDISRGETIENKICPLYLGNPMIEILYLKMETVRELEERSGMKISDRENSN